MKVIAINGSPKHGGNTAQAIKAVFLELEKEGIDCEMIDIGGKEIRGCISCGHCRKTGELCKYGDDEFIVACNKMSEADGLLFASPVYFSGIAGTMKCFLDKAFYSNQKNLRQKVAASIAVCRRSGGTPVFQQLNNYILYNEMIVATSCYWNVAHGAGTGEVTQDAEGMNILKTLGRNMAWLIKMKEESTIEVPGMPDKARTSFIR